jgi:plastocyanin
MERPDRRPGVAQLARAVAVAAGLVVSVLMVAPAPGQQGQAGPPPAHAAQGRPGAVRVTVNLVDARGLAAPARDAVVWIEGMTSAPVVKGKVTAQVAQRHKTFEPHVEVLRVGSTVAFPNLDRIYHNVFSLSEIAPFDLGLYRNGASRSLSFPRPGVVRIYCNIHPSMTAFLVVVNSDAFGKTGADGSVELREVPVGTWPLSAWHERGGEGQASVSVVAGRTTWAELHLDSSEWRASPHKNKYGKDYPPPDDDENRY